MKYINIKTGNIVETAAKVSGDDWKPYKPKSDKPKGDDKAPEGKSEDEK